MISLNRKSTKKKKKKEKETPRYDRTSLPVRSPKVIHPHDQIWKRSKKKRKNEMGVIFISKQLPFQILSTENLNVSGGKIVSLDQV